MTSISDGAPPGPAPAPSGSGPAGSGLAGSGPAGSGLAGSGLAGSGPAGSGPAPGSLPLAAALRSGLTEFAELTGRQPESVTGIRATDTGWSVLADVVELERVPGSTSVMAVYRVDVGRDGHLIGCERLRRFHRGATDAG